VCSLTRSPYSFVQSVAFDRHVNPFKPVSLVPPCRSFHALFSTHILGAKQRHQRLFDLGLRRRRDQDQACPSLVESFGQDVPSIIHIRPALIAAIMASAMASLQCSSEDNWP